jgi:hypothetical protein
MAEQRYEGACHCGRVRFVARGDLAKATVCNCSMCTMKGYIHLVVAPEDFELVAGADDLALYEWGTKIAKHRFCKVCGIHPFYTPRSDPDKIDVNVRCLAGVDVDGLEPARFDGRNWEESMTALEAQRLVPWR